MGHANLLMEVFRVITPEEINELTTLSGGMQRVSITEYLTLKHRGEELDFSPAVNGVAKILPFNLLKQKDEAEEKELFLTGKKVDEYIQQWIIKEKLGDTARDVVTGKAVETSTFIIKEKKRFAYNQAKLKSQEVLLLYKKSLSVDIEQERNFKDDLSKSSRSGVLVNKKQY